MATLRPASFPLVSIVIVNYNSGDDLLRCVSSLVNCTYPRRELIVVDNASSDESIGHVQATYPDVRVVRNPVNLGYSAAANIGITMSEGEFVAVMNPDMLVDPGWLDALIKAAERHPRAAFFQPKLLLMSDPHIINSAGNMIHIAGFGICRDMGTRETESCHGESEICYASGAATVARASALKDIGLLEELYFAYGEDKDWGWRGLMMGWQSVYVPSSRALHRWSATLGESPRKFYLLEFERLLSIWKNYSRRTLVLLAPVFLFVEVSVLLCAAAKGWLSEKLRSYADLLRLREVVAQRRRTVQRRRVVPDRLLLGRFVAEMRHPYLGSAGAVFNRLVSLIFARVRSSI